MPWLYDGVPDRPKWLRRRFIRPSKRRLQREFDTVLPGDGSWMRGVERRSRLRRRVYVVSTDPAVTFGLSLVGGPLAALELNRLTADPPGGSWYLLGLGVLLIILGGWLSRTRAVVDQRRADHWNDTVDQKRLERLEEGIEASLDVAVDALRRDVEALGREVAALGSEITDLGGRLD